MADREQRALFEIDLPYPVETYFQEKGFRLIAGVDEVGRGALAGPVVTAAVILPPDNPVTGIRDSKCLRPRQREILAEEIRKRAIAWSVDFIGNEEVDEINVLQATRKSMTLAVQSLNVQPDLVLIDYVKLDTLDIPCKSLIIISQKRFKRLLPHLSC